MRTLLAAWVAALVATVQPAAARTARTPAALGGDAETGYLDISSDPPAKVLVDDIDTRKTTPVQHLPLKVGHHKLTLVTADGAHARTIGFTVETGQTTKLHVHLTS